MNELDFARNEIAKLHDDIHELTAERDALRGALNQIFDSGLLSGSYTIHEKMWHIAHDALCGKQKEMES